jgi:hypothetical protein
MGGGGEVILFEALLPAEERRVLVRKTQWFPM